MNTSDIFISGRDPDRILIEARTGNVQAWRAASAAEVAVSVGFDVRPNSDDDGHAQYSQFMTAEAARSLGNALLKAADHAEALTAGKAA